MRKNLINVPEFDGLPAPVYFRYAEFDADSHAAPHVHAWGSLDYVAHGVMRYEVNGQRFMSPPQYAVWVPPQTRAQCLQPAGDCLSLGLPGCRPLPELAETPVTLAISDILKAILSDFARRDINIPRSESDKRLAQVLVDQLRQAPVHQRSFALRQSSRSAGGP